MKDELLTVLEAGALFIQLPDQADLIKIFWFQLHWKLFFRVSKVENWPSKLAYYTEMFVPGRVRLR